MRPHPHTCTYLSWRLPRTPPSENQSVRRRTVMFPKQLRRLWTTNIWIESVYWCLSSFIYATLLSGAEKWRPRFGSVCLVFSCRRRWSAALISTQKTRPSCRRGRRPQTTSGHVVLTSRPVCRRVAGSDTVRCGYRACSTTPWTRPRRRGRCRWSTSAVRTGWCCYALCWLPSASTDPSGRARRCVATWPAPVAMSPPSSTAKHCRPTISCVSDPGHPTQPAEKSLTPQNTYLTHDGSGSNSVSKKVGSNRMHCVTVARHHAGPQRNASGVNETWQGVQKTHRAYMTRRIIQIATAVHLFAVARPRGFRGFEPPTVHYCHSWNLHKTVRVPLYCHIAIHTDHRYSDVIA